MTSLGYCIPVLNMASTIRATLDSIHAQVGAVDITVAIIDGGSTDGTVELVNEWIEQRRWSGIGSREYVCISQRDNSMYEAVGTGLNMLAPRAAVLGWLNADDVLLPGAAQRLIDAYDADAELAWTLHPVVQFDESGKVIFAGPPPTIWGKRHIAEGLYDGATFPLLPQEAMSWRSAVWQEVGSFPPSLRLAGDYWLWRTFATNGYNPSTLSFPLGAFRRRKGQLSQGHGYSAELDTCRRALLSSTPTGHQRPAVAVEAKR